MFPNLYELEQNGRAKIAEECRTAERRRQVSRVRQHRWGVESEAAAPPQRTRWLQWVVARLFHGQTARAAG